MSASLLVGQRKMIFYKILCSSNIVSKILSALHRNEAQKRSSAYNILPLHSRNIDIKLVKFCQFIYNLITCDISLLLFCLCVCSFLECSLSVCLQFCVLCMFMLCSFLVFYFCAASHGVMKND